MVKVNLKGQELREFDVIPRGTYRVTVDQCDDTRMSQAGYPNIFWLFKVTDVLRVQGETPEGLVGRTVMHGTSLQESALWNLYRTLLALGDDPEAIESGDFEVKPENYLGRECVVTVNIRPYEGVDQNQITQIRALNEQELSKIA